MIGIIVVIDQLIWRPMIAWAEKFKFEQVESTDAPHSPVLDLLRSSSVVPFIARFTIRPAGEALSLYFARKHATAFGTGAVSRKARASLMRLFLACAACGVWCMHSCKMVLLLVHLTR